MLSALQHAARRQASTAQHLNSRWRQAMGSILHGKHSNGDLHVQRICTCARCQAIHGPSQFTEKACHAAKTSRQLRPACLVSHLSSAP